MDEGFGWKVWALLRRFLETMHFPLSVIMRQEMGEAYCSFKRLWVHSCIMPGACAFLAHSIAGIAVLSANDGYALNTLLCLMWIFGLTNLRQIWERRRGGGEVHSRSIGVPRFLPATYFSNMWLVPLTTITVGWVVSLYSVAVGLYIGLVVCQS